MTVVVKNNAISVIAGKKNVVLAVKGNLAKLFK